MSETPEPITAAKNRYRTLRNGLKLKLSSNRYRYYRNKLKETLLGPNQLLLLLCNSPFEVVEVVNKHLLSTNPSPLSHHDLLQCIHPDDADLVLNSLSDLWDTLRKNPQDTANVVLTGNWRSYNAQNILTDTHASVVTLEADHLGQPLLWLLFISFGGATSEISHPTALVCSNQQSGQVYFQNTLHQPQPVRFTPRELEVLQLLSQGKTSKEIAHLLHISKPTADGYRKQMFEKTGTKNTTELMAVVIRMGALSSIK